MESLALEFTRKAGEHGTLFGSVTSMDVAEALQGKGYEIDRRKIVMKDAIKETGEYTVNVKLHREVMLYRPGNRCCRGRRNGSEAGEKDEKRAETACGRGKG